MILIYGALGIMTVILILFIGLSMVAPNLGITKKVKESLSNAMTQSIIAVILTVGYVIVMVLGGLGIMTVEAFNAVMADFRIIYAIVVGFYFAVQYFKNGKSSQTSDSTLDVILRMFSESQITSSQAENNVIELNKTVNRLEESMVELIQVTKLITKKVFKEPEESKEPEPEEVVDRSDPSGAFG